jgi:toxin ParE1/3/4
MVVKYLNSALGDLESIADYISQDNPEAAKNVIKELKETINLLLVMPDMGQTGRVFSTRDLIKSHYIIPYRVIGKQIEILRVFDTSQKPPVNW